MGIATWFGASAVAVTMARTILSRGALPLVTEIFLAAAAAGACGLLATALDFGGWNEPDWRAASLAFLGAAACLPAARAFSIRRGRRALS